MTRMPVIGTRAVLRIIEAGYYAVCPACTQPVKFRAKARGSKQVVCNVYRHGRWDRVEHYHAECYRDAGEPHGAAA